MDNLKNIVNDVISRKLNNIVEEIEPVMSKYYGILSNDHRPVKLTEMNLNRLLTKHANNGFIIISANRSDKENKVNNEQTRNLIADIRKSGFSYFPVYGGYRGKDEVVDSFEPSFVCVPYDKSGNEMSFEDLANFAIEMCGVYNQDSVLIKAPKDLPKYYDREGKVIGKATDDSVIKNDLNQEFFTSLIKTKNIDNDNPSRSKRFTYPMQFECYTNPQPTTLNEKRRRMGWGEIIL